MKMQARKRGVETRPYRDQIGRIIGYHFEPGVEITFTISDRQISKMSTNEIANQIKTASRFVEHAIEQRIYQLNSEA